MGSCALELSTLVPASSCTPRVRVRADGCVYGLELVEDDREFGVIRKSLELFAEDVTCLSAPRLQPMDILQGGGGAFLLPVSSLSCRHIHARSSVTFLCPSWEFAGGYEALFWVQTGKKGELEFEDRDLSLDRLELLLRRSTSRREPAHLGRRSTRSKRARSKVAVHGQPATEPAYRRRRVYCRGRPVFCSSS